MAPGWCRVCSTQHGSETDCPGNLIVHGPEKRGRWIRVFTDRGNQTFGVLLAESNRGWRARIITYPNIPWVIPGSSETMKFFDRSAWEVEQRALGFIRALCHAKRHQIHGEGGGVDSPRPVMPLRRRPLAPRKSRAHVIRFGVTSPSSVARTADLSESGLFIVTDSPQEPGTRLTLQLEIPGTELALLGVVRWMRRAAGEGRAAGMGVALQSPPLDYRRYVRELAAAEKVVERTR